MITRKRPTLPWIACCLFLAGCAGYVAVGGRNADFRTTRPEPVIFDASRQTLPGAVITGASELGGIWGFGTPERWVRDVSGQPLFYYGLYLKLAPDNSYELTYQSYWNTRDMSSPAMHATDVRERGRFELSGGKLRLRPQTAELAEKQAGQLARRTIANESREYVAKLDGAYLNIAGPCATYQVEPVCQHNKDAWYSLRSSRIEWPIPALD